MLYNVHNLDVWGNDDDGYQVNDVYPSFRCVEIGDDMTDKEIFWALGQADIIDQGEADKFVIEGESGYALYASYNGKPVFELRPVDDNNSAREGGI